MHLKLKFKKDYVHQRNLKAQGKVENIKFDVGDYLLLSRNLRPPAGKLAPTWVGPYQITKIISDWVFEVKNLLKPTEVSRVMGCLTQT